MYLLHGISPKSKEHIACYKHITNYIYIVAKHCYSYRTLTKHCKKNTHSSNSTGDKGLIVQWLSSQICNVCALLETSTKFGTLVDMVTTITTGYRTTSTAPPGGWWRHILNVGTCCHTSVHNFGSKRNFFSLFSDLYPGDVD